MNLKYNLAKRISSGYAWVDDPTYDHLLESIYNNIYRTVLKVPISTFILGNVQSYIIKDLEHANLILKYLKEVVVDALEFSGLELTFTDEDWINLTLLENTRGWGGKYILSKNDEIEGKLASKSYMSEFFEL